MSSCYRVFIAVALAFSMGWFNVATAVGTGQEEGDLVAVTALKVQSVSTQSTQVLLESSARFDYTVLRPENNLITVDLYGVDTSKLQPVSAVGDHLVNSINIKPVGLPGKVATRVEIELTRQCEIKSHFITDTNTLSLNLATTIQPNEAKEVIAVKNEKNNVDVKDKANDDVKSSQATLGTVVKDISTEDNEQYFSTKIVSNGPLNCNHFLLHQPERLVIDVRNTHNLVVPRSIKVSNDIVARIRVGTPSVTATRIVFDLKKSANYEVINTDTGLVVKIDNPKLNILNIDNKVAKQIEPQSFFISENSIEESSPRIKQISEKKIIEVEPILEKEDDFVEDFKLPSVNIPTQSIVDPLLQPIVLAKNNTASDVVNPPHNNIVASTTSTATAVRKASKSTVQFGDQDFRGDPISLDITGVDLSDILRFLSNNYDVNFVVDKSVPKVEVTIKVNNVPWGQVIDSIFRANRLSYKREGMIVRVATLEAFSEEESQFKKQRESAIDNLPLITEYFKLKYEQVLTNTNSGFVGIGGAGGGVGGGGAGGGAGGAGGGGVGLRAILGQNLSLRGNISANPRTNTLVVTDIPDNIARAREIIQRLDVPEPQVEIEARIVQANRSFIRDLGVQLFTGVVSRRGGGIGLSTSGGTSYGFGFGSNNDKGSGIIRGSFRPGNFASADSLFIGPLASGNLGGRGADTVLSLTTGIIGSGFISAAITAAESKGIVKTISAPRVTVQNNSEGEIRAGRSIPFTAAQAIGSVAIATTTFVEAVLSLKITPQITSEGNVLLRLESTNDSVDLSFSVNGQPPINRQSSKTIVLVPDGGTTIIGGINIDSENNLQNRTPGISSLPIIGNLFKQRLTNRTTQELLFFITPRIFRGENFVTRTDTSSSSQSTNLPRTTNMADSSQVPGGGK